MILQHRLSNDVVWENMVMDQLELLQKWYIKNDNHDNTDFGVLFLQLALPFVIILGWKRNITLGMNA